MINVRIIRLEPMRVASSYGFGLNPEEIAWQRMASWAGPRGFLNDFAVHPIFGFNNPYPTPGNPRYGYEFWLKVGREVEPEGEIRIGEFFGGAYAVARCEAQGHPEINIPAGWQSLAEWCKDNNYRPGPNALERFLSSPDDPANLIVELCCPILA